MHKYHKRKNTLVAAFHYQAASVAYVFYLMHLKTLFWEGSIYVIRPRGGGRPSYLSSGLLFSSLLGVVLSPVTGNFLGSRDNHARYILVLPLALSWLPGVDVGQAAITQHLLTLVADSHHTRKCTDLCHPVAGIGFLGPQNRNGEETLEKFPDRLYWPHAWA